MPYIPQSYAQKIAGIYGEPGERWLKNLDALLAYCTKEWAIILEEPFELSYNYVVPVVFSDQSRGVLKVCVPDKQCAYEIAALKIYGDNIMCELLASDAGKGILLLKRLMPGDSLKSIRSDEEAIAIAADLVKRMRSSNIIHGKDFPAYSSWADGLRKYKPGNYSCEYIISESILHKTFQLFDEIFATQRNAYLLHGDFHHDNILSHNDGWKLIDPKGVIGEVENEIIPFLMNNLPGKNIDGVIKNRAKIFAEELDLDLHRLFMCGFCHAVLSVWWNIEDNLKVSTQSQKLIAVFHELTNE